MSESSRSNRGSRGPGRSQKNSGAEARRATRHGAARGSRAAIAISPAEPPGCPPSDTANTTGNTAVADPGSPAKRRRATSPSRSEVQSQARCPVTDGSQADAGGRSVVCYLGPTNSGKTHDALEFLAVRGSGAYAGPLRLLALEVCQTLRRKLGHAKVGCKTGEEEDLPEADVLCCTAECAPEAGDTLVLDEVHWLVDEGRGHAWTRLLVLAKRWRHVRICGPVEAEPLLRKVFADRGADVTFEVQHTARLSRLEFRGSWASPLGQLAPGNGRTVAIVAFTKAAVLGVAYIVKRKHNLRVAALYGAQPPETRVEILRQVAAGEVDVVVTTDVIGHGVNLPLDAVLFVSTSKWDGRQLRPLKAWEIGQIAGRAGRGASRPGAVYALSLDELPDERPSLDLIRRGVEVANGGPGAASDLVVTHGRLRPSLKELRRLGAGASPPEPEPAPELSDDYDSDYYNPSDYNPSDDDYEGNDGYPSYSSASRAGSRAGSRARWVPPHNYTTGLAAAVRKWGDASTAARDWSPSMRTWCTTINTAWMASRIESLPAVRDPSLLEAAWSLAQLPVTDVHHIAEAVFTERHVRVPAARAETATGEDLEGVLRTLGDVMVAARIFPRILPPEIPLARVEALYHEGSARLARALQSRIDAGGLCPRCNYPRQNLRHRLCQSCFGR